MLRLVNPPKWTEIDRFTFPEWFARDFLLSEIVCLGFSLFLAVVASGVLGFCLQRFALGCEIHTRVAIVATQGTMQQCQAEACSITPASSREIKGIQPNN